MLLKWRRKSGEWVVMYGDALKNRLRRDKNLADLTNRTEAKKNLGVFGEVKDHYHDDRYMPYIKALEGNLDSEIKARKDSDKANDKALRKKIEAEVEAVLKAYKASIADESKVRADKDNDLSQKIALEVKNRTKLLADIKSIQDKDRAKAKSLVDDEIAMRTTAIEESEKKESAEREKIKKLITNETSARKTAIDTEVKNRNTAISNKAKDLEGKITTEATNRTNAIEKAKDVLIDRIAEESADRAADVSALENADSVITEAYKKADKAIKDDIVARFSHFHVGKAAPAKPVNNKTIWFCITDDTERIRIYKGNKWVDFGSRYLPG